MSILIAALLAMTPISNEQAQKAVPGVDLSDLTDVQRGQFLDVAAEVLNYSGCPDTLALCLRQPRADPHAVRMAQLVKQFLRDGAAPVNIIQALEQYYASFEQRQRQNMRTDDCPIEGKGPVTIVEFSDYQCPHCAHALPELTKLVTEDRKGVARLCSKYFPFSSHPRARIAALCAEYARTKGKFWEMNQMLFTHQDALEDADLKTYANQLGLNGDEMLKEVYGGRLDTMVEKNLREGTSAGVESTPSLFVDGRLNTLPARAFYLSFTVDDEVQWKKERGWHPGGNVPAAAEEKPATKKVAKGK